MQGGTICPLSLPNFAYPDNAILCLIRHDITHDDARGTHRVPRGDDPNCWEGSAAYHNPTTKVKKYRRRTLWPSVTSVTRMGLDWQPVQWGRFAGRLKDSTL